MDIDTGDVIRRLRSKLGLTQEEFAHAIAVTVSTVNRWENDHTAPSKLAWKVIRELARKRGLADDLQPGAPARKRRRETTSPSSFLRAAAASH
jgi:transcriptional regulator with XRE-family HTH domain